MHMKEPMYLAIVPMIHVPAEERIELLIWMKLSFAQMCTDKYRFGVSEAEVAFYYGLGEHACTPTKEEEIIVKEQMLRQYPHVVKTIGHCFKLRLWRKQDKKAFISLIEEVNQ